MTIQPDLILRYTSTCQICNGFLSRAMWAIRIWTNKGKKRTYCQTCGRKVLTKLEQSK